MHHFNFKSEELYCEEVPLKKIASEVGTPFYCYSQATLTRHVQQFSEPFKDVDALLCYAVKANSNIAVLRLLLSLGCGADIVSGGELFRVLKAGGERKKIVFSGVGKREDEIEFALKEKILSLNVESAQELELVSNIAKKLKTKAPISIRVNPDIDPKTHPYISTGLLQNKFGIPLKEAIGLFHKASKDPNLDLVGIDCHIGSQVTELAPFLDALRSIKNTIKQLKSEGIKIDHLDIGGGLGITYSDENPPHPRDYAKAVLDELAGLDLMLIMEPGRVIVGNAGILVTKVLFTKHTSQKEFVIVDAAMNDLIRPGLYNAYQEIIPVKESSSESTKVVDVVGPVCETGDFLARERKMPTVSPGDLLAVMSAGAYGFSMSSNYNSRPRVAEILVNGDKFAVIRKREALEDLILGETMAHWLGGKD
ncbi:MAG: diaminopimelate decarboxylase [Deltaproteobacteria bacterium RIFCSPHIGHO2_12_FULL_43_9]|nr:MAG: diaminopimelate decarboxylase [Deltaproteobacteria bacterium RIFCSPHIGHO2_12_FULL_43_9]